MAKIINEIKLFKSLSFTHHYSILYLYDEDEYIPDHIISSGNIWTIDFYRGVIFSGYKPEVSNRFLVTKEQYDNLCEKYYI